VENKITSKESDFDKIVDTTFKLGMSDKERAQKRNLALPHFDKIDREIDNGGITELVDDEQDAEDDVDV